MQTLLYTQQVAKEPGSTSEIFRLFKALKRFFCKFVFVHQNTNKLNRVRKFVSSFCRSL